MKVKEIMKNNEYIMDIGIEVHVGLNTKTKMFCSCSTKFGKKPNSMTCPICMAMPGTLPILNKEVVNHAIRTALALNCQISKNTHFDRKNYFYPDLPKAYQTSQLSMPIGKNGRVEIEVNGKKKHIGIHKMHMEEDAGKLVHQSNYSLVDYNRAGLPLLEIVSAPHMTSADEAVAFLEELRSILVYLNVTDGKMQEGSFRADINLSVRKEGDTALGIRTEMKNLNSFRSVTRAIHSEYMRQVKVLETGKNVLQETRRWDDHVGESVSMRSKADSQDYLYVKDPDLPPIIIDDQWINEIRQKLPELRADKMKRYITKYHLSEKTALILTDNKKISEIFDETVSLYNKPKEISHWLMMEGLRIVREEGVDGDEIILSAPNLVSLIMMIEEGKINRTIAKEIFELIFKEDINPQEYVEKNKLGIISDESLLTDIIKDIIENNPESVEDYKNGKTKVVTYLMGQTMKTMGGRTEPKVASEIIKKILDEI